LRKPLFMKTLYCFFILFATTVLTAQTEIKNVDSKTFKNYMKEKNTVLIDLRTDEEIAKKGSIPGSIQIDYFKPDAEKKIDALDRKKTYLVYCAGGGRSSECADLMSNKKFARVINLEKGFDDWKKQGFETEQKKSTK
jgi:phage shock protein E